ncbi:rust resistance kinase Lr10 [Brachypodium distachyon]|uniref:chitinase n=1 Tax=Brachypodium distachyon TaxID=15368 RepID=A0A0Q3GDD1_BRADI|nr:rust resistance kinase Lr10 [Brachypodium distachyon]KQK09288.1 hypothetical protein BRADI_2g47191v3 [Brachypodium distachyon]|eukprot:XP_010232173.1 rust resistance kinase Lr10 [Brachypodium distachyon]
MKSAAVVAMLAAAILAVFARTEQCGSQAGGATCPDCLCCSRFGFCGSTSDYCGSGCQSQCSGCSSVVTPAPAPSGGSALSSVVSRSLFDKMLLHRNDAACPAKGFYTYDAFVAAANSFLGFATTGGMDIRKREVAAFLAQTSHETTGGGPTSPDGPYSWGYCFKQEIARLDYCTPSSQWPCAAGKKYYGRGPIQITYNYNYGPAGQAIGNDLLGDPDLVATDATVSFRTALWFWMTAQAPNPSSHDVITGRWQAAGNLSGFGMITNIINGELECGRGQDNRAVADRIGFYKRYCDLLGVSYGDNLDCYNQRPLHRREATIGTPIGSPPATSPVLWRTETSPKKRAGIYVIAGTSSLVGVCLFILALFLWYKKYYRNLSCQRGSKNTPRIESFLEKEAASYPKRYTYSEVRRMTNSFAHKLGQGGFGAVYRGKFPDGREIAVKMLKDTKGDGEEFMNEVASISRTSHINVVTLLGFCLRGSKRALIYEYMINGSLERYTFGNSSVQNPNALSWERLFDIVLGIARGLEYLHQGCNTRIVHFDIKPQNILLDEEFCPKISDFGLAKLCQQKESKISIGGARGTVGYIAPEVFSRQYGAVSSKSDVYGYGMVVLEMVGAKNQINVSTDNSTKYFPQWIYDNFDEFCGTTCEIVSSEPTELLRKMTIVGLWCIQLTPTDRPSMSKVLDMLESNSEDLQLPPKAY